MNTKAHDRKAFPALARRCRPFDGSFSRLLSASTLVCGPKVLDASAQRRRLIGTRLFAAALLLAAVGSAQAGGRMTVTAASGGQAISASTANGAWTTLSGPILKEGDAGSIQANGTIVLTVPPGFEFDTTATVTVLVTGGTGPQNINGVPSGGTIPVSVTSTTLTVVLTSKSAGGDNANTLTFQNIQVRPTAPSPLASGDLVESGTCGFQAVALSSGTWGHLQEIAPALVGSSLALNSSANPAPQGTNLQFTATVSAVGRATTPTGTVQFFANGQPLGDPVTLSAGLATVSTAQLSLGSNLVSAVYSGDPNCSGSSSSLVQNVQANIQNSTIVSITKNPDGTATVVCQGVPGVQYLVQATSDLTPPSTWETVSTNVADYFNGRWTIVTDTQFTQRFFRTAQP